jgi:hypothetical protein
VTGAFILKDSPKLQGTLQPYHDLDEILSSVNVQRSIIYAHSFVLPTSGCSGPDDGLDYRTRHEVYERYPDDVMVPWPALP